MKQFVAGIMKDCAKRCAVFGLAMLLAASPALADQSSLFNPTTGTLPGLTMVNGYNSALNAVNTCNSGASAPSNQLSGGPSEGNCWLNTSTGAVSYYDGTSWLTVGYLDTTNHIWTPVVGGNVATSVASATTTNLCGSSGASPQGAYLTITGVTTITGFGSNCVVGQSKKLVFSGILTLTYNSGSMILPTLASIITAAGDTADAVYLGSGNWRITNYLRATGIALAQPAGTSLSGGFLNLFRNGTFDIWQRGFASLTVTTSGQYTADGWWVIPTGASVAAAEAADPVAAPLALYGLKVTGASSVSDITLKHPIESYYAAKVKGQTFTVQFEFDNQSNVSVTPTLTTRYPSAQDNYGSSTVDISAVAFQACASGSVCLESLTEIASASIGNGYEADIDFGNHWANASYYLIVSEADFRVTPGGTAGLNSTPPSPEMRPIAAELPFNERYYQTTYGNGVAPATATHNGMCGGGTNNNSSSSGGACGFPEQMRAAPTIAIWDGAGNANKASVPASSSSWSDNTDSPATLSIGLAGFTWTQGGTTGGGNGLFIHYSASAEITP